MAIRVSGRMVFWFLVAAIVVPTGVHSAGRIWRAIRAPSGSDPRLFDWADVDITDVDSDAWVEIPGGTFMMGSKQFPTYTGPVHSVTVPTFRMSRFPITNEQYVAYLRANPSVYVPLHLSESDYPRSHGRVLRDSIREGWDRHPMTDVTWYEAMEYVRWLDEQVDGHVSLPTEAQWEYAARGTEGRKYPWGNRKPSPERAAYGSRDGPMPSVLRIGPTSGPGWAGFRVPVDTYLYGATPEGVYDLAGNVWEWVADCFHRGGYNGAPDNGAEWGGGVCDRETADVRMMRGGSWRSSAPLLLAARRSSARADERRGWYGFRVAWSPEGEQLPPSEQGAQQVLYYPHQFDAIAPDTFTADFETTEGQMSIRVYRAWAPASADRFFNLVSKGFYDGNRIYRVMEGVLAQWGLNGNSEVDRYWRFASIPMDTVLHPNTRGRVSFASSMDEVHTTEVFINYADNPTMDEEGHASFGKVVRGMDVAERFYSAYGDGVDRSVWPWVQGTGPDRDLLAIYGNEFIDPSFPKLSRILRAWVE